MTKLQKLDILTKQTRCPECGDKPGALDEIDWDHRIPLALGGSNSPENFVWMHRNCHAVKTAHDKKSIAKAKRIAAKDTGVGRKKVKIPSRPFPKRKKERNERKHFSGDPEDKERGALPEEG